MDASSLSIGRVKTKVRILMVIVASVSMSEVLYM